MRTSDKTGIGIIAVGITILLLIGIEDPPEKLNATELSIVEKIKVNNEINSIKPDFNPILFFY